MKRYEWSIRTDAEVVRWRAGGRRRLNALRQQRAWERRAQIARWLKECPVAWLFTRGLPGKLAPAFGAHPSTIWRDLQCILYAPREYSFYSKGELLFTVYRDYPGGPVVGLEDPDGNEIRGRHAGASFGDSPGIRGSRPYVPAGIWRLTHRSRTLTCPTYAL